MIRPLAALRMPVVSVVAALVPAVALAVPAAAAPSTAPAAAPATSVVPASEPNSAATAVRATVGTKWPTPQPAVEPRQPAASRTAGARTAPAVEPDPLLVTIDSMTPSVIPRKGPIRLSGTVTNTSDDVWRDVKIYPRLSSSPLTTSAEVDLAADSDPRLPFGDRITTEGNFDESITSLEPGQSRTWTIRVKREIWDSRIIGSEGIYQIGVQALAATEEGERPANAIGRARTFIPLVDPGHSAVPTSLVVPVRGTVRRHADGRVADPEEWAALLENGRLAHLADMMRDSDAAPITWAVDPAVVSAVEQLAKGNPARELGAPEDEKLTGENEEAEASAPTASAQAWLDDLTSLSATNEVLALPYGDLDVAASSTYDASLYRLARDLSEDLFKRLKVSTVPAVVPPSGLLPADAFDDIEPTTTMLMSEEAIPGSVEELEGDESFGPSRLSFEGHTMSLYDAALLNVPDEEEQNAVTVRQRALAEAAIRSLSDSTEPLVVNLPTDFDPGTSAEEFFAGLQRPFLDLRRLSGNTGGTTRNVRHVDYPARQQERELGGGAFGAAQALINAGATLDDIVAGSDGIERRSAEEALTYTSYMVRDTQVGAEQLARGATTWLNARLGLVTIDAPSFVILSAANGPFAVKITNGLDVPVTLSLEARTQDKVEIRAPERIEVGANASRSIQLTAETHSIGVHRVDLVATDSSGRTLGSSEEMSVRSNSVGRVIWVILGVGVGILFLAIPVRLIRRYRRSKAA